MGISSFGTLLKRGDGAAPEVFTTVAEVLDIKGPKLSADEEDTTNHSSTDGYEEFVMTIKSGGELSFEVNFLPDNASHNAASGLLLDFNNTTKRNWKLVFPNQAATTWSFAAYVKEFEPAAPVKGKLTASITLRVSGKPTLA